MYPPRYPQPNRSLEVEHVADCVTIRRLYEISSAFERATGAERDRGLTHRHWAATNTARGLRVKAAVDSRLYPPAVKATAADPETPNLRPARFHGDRTYTATPNSTRRHPTKRLR